MNIFNKLFRGDKRSSRAKKNMLASLFLKGIDGIIYLAVVPATLGFLDKYSYGLWLTINAVLTWINSFDIGLGNGLRNCLTKAIAVEDYEKGRIYISTTYFLLALLSIVIMCVFMMLNIWIDWYSFFNVDHDLIPNLKEVIIYSFLFFCISFVLNIINSVYMALQLNAVSNSFKAVGYLLSLLLIIILRATIGHGSLMIVALIFSAIPCLVYLVVTPITFARFYPELKPSISLVRLKGYVKSLFVVGVNFFIMQMCVLILQFSTNIVISNLFGPEQVTPFNIANRYMYIGVLLMTVIIAPIWSAVTDAYARGDWEWIKRTQKKIQRITLLLGVFLCFLLMISKSVYQLWVGSDVEIPFAITFLNALYVFLLIWSTGQSTFLNGLNILRVQLYANIFQALLFFPLVYYLGRLYGINGLVVGLILSNIPAAMMNTLQVKLIIKGKAHGIWLK